MYWRLRRWVLRRDPSGFLGGAELPRRSDVGVSVVHRSEVAYISSKTVTFPVTLWTDVVERGRRFDLLAPGSVVMSGRYVKSGRAQVREVR